MARSISSAREALYKSGEFLGKDAPSATVAFAVTSTATILVKQPTTVTFTNDLWEDDPTDTEIVKDVNSHIGEEFDTPSTLGPGDAFSLKIFVQDTGEFRQQSDSSDCVVTQVDSETVRLAFEDDTDDDFNDVIVDVSHPNGITVDGQATTIGSDPGLTEQPSRVTVRRDQADDSHDCIIEWPNVNPDDPTDGGYYSHDRGDDIPADKNEWYNVLGPGTDLTVDLGYGGSEVRSMTGNIDRVKFDVDPEAESLYMVKIKARDVGYKLLDRAVKDGSGNYSKTYTNAVNTITDEELTLDGFNVSTLTETSIETDSETVTNSAGTTTYVKDTDYEINYAAGEIVRITGTSIGDGDTVKVDYNYNTWPVEDIVADVWVQAGNSASDLTTEATGVVVTEKTFERMYWGDVITWCEDVSAFNFTIYEDGTAELFYPTDRQPEAADLKFTLNGTTAVDITGTTDDDGTDTGRAPVVTGSEVVTDLNGDAYVKDTDYTITYGGVDTEATLVRIDTGNISDGEQVLVDYVYAAYTFEEGKDIYRLPYQIDRHDIYETVRVIGKDSNGDPTTGTFTYTGEFSDAVTDKVLFVEEEAMNTDTKAQTLADQLGNDMQRRARVVRFEAIGVPELQLGDTIQVIEKSTTISEAYRILDLTHNLTPRGFTMTLTCYHYGHAPL